MVQTVYVLILIFDVPIPAYFTDLNTYTAMTWDETDCRKSYIVLQCA